MNKWQSIISCAVITATATQSAFAADTITVEQLRAAQEQKVVAGQESSLAPYAVQTLILMEKKFGTNSPELFDSLMNLAAVYMANGKYSSAEPVLLRASGIEQEQTNPDLERQALTFFLLSRCYREMGKEQSAETASLMSFSLKKRLQAEATGIAKNPT